MKKSMIFAIALLFGMAIGSIAAEPDATFSVTITLNTGETMEVALDNTAGAEPVFTYGYNPIALQNIKSVKPVTELKTYINAEGDVYSKQKFEITLHNGKRYFVTAKNFDAWFENSTGLAWNREGVQLSAIEFKNSDQMTATR